jgi:hypothetical protein
MWNVISNKRYRDIIGWLGAGAAAIGGGGWAVYTYLNPIEPSKPANCAVRVVNGVAGCGDIDIGGDVNISSDGLGAKGNQTGVTRR